MNRSVLFAVLGLFAVAAWADRTPSPAGAEVYPVSERPSPLSSGPDVVSSRRAPEGRIATRISETTPATGVLCDMHAEHTSVTCRGRRRPDPGVAFQGLFKGLRFQRYAG